MTTTDVAEMSTDEIEAMLSRHLTGTRAEPSDLSEGVRVEWESGGGMAYGEIDTVETDGTIEARPEGPSMDGTEEEPAYLVQVFQPGEDGWEGSDVFVVHRADALMPIDDFPEGDRMDKEEEGDKSMHEDKEKGYKEDDMRVFCQRAVDPMMVKQGIKSYLEKNEQDEPYCYFKALYVESVDGDRAAGYAIIDKVAQCYKARWTYEPGSFMMQPKDSWVKVQADYEEMDGMQEVTDGMQGGMEQDKQMNDEGGMRSVSGFQRALVPGEIRVSSDKERISVQIMTEDIARDGMVLRADGLKTDDYERNPVVLWNHGATYDQPIARCVDLVRVDGGLRATVEFDRKDEFAAEIERKVREKYLNAVSIGWRTLDSASEEIEGRRVPVVTEADMTEFSFVSVPADANALVTARTYDGDLDSMLDDLRAMYKDLKTFDVDEVGILEAMREVVREELESLRSSTDNTATISVDANSINEDRTATADTPSHATESDATAAGSADGERDAWSETDMTRADVDALMSDLKPFIKTSVRQALGKA